MKHNKYWFKPKGFGYGATPTSWEGWVVVAVFILYLVSMPVWLKERNTNEYLLYFLTGVIAIFIISKSKTEGEWKWSWGKKKEVEK